MARPLRIEFPGAIYHVTSRGDRREPIFEDDEDRHKFLIVVGQAMERFDATVLAYCLMDNHYHIVVHTRRANLSRLMQQLNGVYTQAYNLRHRKVGHLFQGRFKGILVDENAYLLEVCRYVDLNPLRARMVRDPGDWPWSSYGAHTGRTSTPAWLDTAAVQGYLLGRDTVSAADRRKAQQRYVAFVAAGKGVKLWDEALAQQIFLGGPEFVERMQALVDLDAAAAKDIPRKQRRAQSKPIRYYLENHKNRDAGIVAAVRDGQHSMTDIAAALKLSVSRVSRIVKKLGLKAIGESSGGNPICMVRPTALAEPDLERYTIRLPARVFGGVASRHVKQISLVVMGRVRSVSGHVSLIRYLAPAPLRSPRITRVHRYYGRLRLPGLDAFSLAV